MIRKDLFYRRAQKGFDLVEALRGRVHSHLGKINSTHQSMGVTDRETSPLTATSTLVISTNGTERH